MSQSILTITEILIALQNHLLQWSHAADQKSQIIYNCHGVLLLPAAAYSDRPNLDVQLSFDSSGESNHYSNNTFQPHWNAGKAIFKKWRKYFSPLTQTNSQIRLSSCPSLVFYPFLQISSRFLFSINCFLPFPLLQLTSCLTFSCCTFQSACFWLWEPKRHKPPTNYSLTWNY